MSYKIRSTDSSQSLRGLASGPVHNPALTILTTDGVGRLGYSASVLNWEIHHMGYTPDQVSLTYRNRAGESASIDIESRYNGFLGSLRGSVIS